MEVISRETIKPSTPTPPHLRIYPLSSIDHIVFRNYVPLLFFYSNQSFEIELHRHDDNTNKVCDERSKMLKKSLSQVLAMYYPLAGRFKDQLCIECNDEGVTLLLTRITCKLSHVLKNPSQDSINPLFPDELQWKEMDPRGSILAVQINHFVCGGMAISVCMSHKVGDASTLFNFVKDWAAITTKKSYSQVIPPVLNGGSILPLGGNLPNYPEVVFVKDDNMVCKRFVFEASKIESLKAMVSSHTVKNPTRVQVVSALIYKSAISALSSSRVKCGNKQKQSTWLRVAANLRTRMVPPLPEKTVGNMVWFFFVSGTTEAELHELVSETQEKLCEFCDEYGTKFGRNEVSFISECLKAATSSGTQDEDDMVMFYVASWCRFGGYEGDFGWGKPIWMTTSGCPVKNSIVLMDTRDGDGIEALVNMQEHDMAVFERDEQLRLYASLNPSLV